VGLGAVCRDRCAEDSVQVRRIPDVVGVSVCRDDQGQIVRRAPRFGQRSLEMGAPTSPLLGGVDLRRTPP